MYNPSKFKVEDLDKSLDLISRYPLATLISHTADGPFVSHLPLVAEKTSDGLFLYGHLARANPHLKLLKTSSVYIIFHGPNGYITPSWYAEHDVPTWNYAVVHMQGECELMENSAAIEDCLKRLTHQMEAKRELPWEFSIPSDLSAPGVMERAITGFKISVMRMQAKFKLSQNRNETDRAGVINGLQQEGNDASREMLRLMRE